MYTRHAASPSTGALISSFFHVDYFILYLSTIFTESIFIIILGATSKSGAISSTVATSSISTLSTCSTTGL